jgi:uncharacterized LabA/DUF88 family protein
MRYLFIDGGYLRKQFYDSLLKFFEVEPEMDFIKMLKFMNVSRSFYYDCLNDIKLKGESEADFRLRVNTQEDLFNEISEISNCHVRLGSLTGTAKNRRQKEVDILLAVDMMNHAVRQNAQKVLLLAGDRDFKPVVESLVNMGVFVEVLGDKRNTSMELARAADVYHRIRLKSYYDWATDEFQRNHKISIESTKESSFPQHKPIETGAYKNKEVEIFSIQYGKSVGTKYYLQIKNFTEKSETLTLEYADLDKLKIYFELQYGQIKWT